MGRGLKYTIKDMQAIAKANGGKCLSKEYKGAVIKLEWQCSEGHQFSKVPNEIISHNSWCPVCSRKRTGDRTRGTIEQMKELAIKRGGKCLSDNYINALTPIQWQCGKEHTWYANPGSISSGSWCPRCKGSTIGKFLFGNIEEYQRIANKKGGKCISPKYLGSNVKHEWQCAKGHVWKAKPNAIKTGTWCPHCYGHIKRSIEFFHSYAQQHGGICLSTEYFHDKKLKFQCSQGHFFESGIDSIRAGRWCSACKKERNKLKRLKPPVQ